MFSLTKVHFFYLCAIKGILNINSLFLGELNLDCIDKQYEFLKPRHSKQSKSIKCDMVEPSQTLTPDSLIRLQLGFMALTTMLMIIFVAFTLR